MERVKILVLVDGLHSRETFASLASLLDLRSSRVLLAYVTGPGPRAGLDLMRHGPRARPLPPHRERELREAEESAGGDAISDAEAAAREHGAETESIVLAGKPGHAVCALADQHDVDLVVVRAGGRDLPSIGPGSLGPAARFIADHCRAPVLLLRS